MLKKIIKLISFLLCFILIFEQSGFAQVAGQLDISAHVSAGLSNIIQDKFRPIHLRYFELNPTQENFKLLLDKGSVKNPNQQLVDETTKELLKYFLIGVSLPNDAFWVNLRPDVSNEIIDENLAKTDVGKILLEADLQLKKDTAKYTSPNTLEGKEYWNKLYQKAEELYGNTQTTIPTLNRPWIVPDEIIVRENQGSVYIYKATLKVMLEGDYLKGSQTYNFTDEKSQALNEYSSQLLKETIIPKITKEINSAKRYAALRQVYYSLILAQWFKKVYGNDNNVLSPQQLGSTISKKIDSKDLTNLSSQEPWSTQTYYQSYQKSFKEGEYNVKEPRYTASGQVIRNYVSGGIVLDIAKFFGSVIQSNSDLNVNLKSKFYEVMVSLNFKNEIVIKNQLIKQDDGGDEKLEEFVSFINANLKTNFYKSNTSNILKHSLEVWFRTKESLEFVDFFKDLKLPGFYEDQDKKIYYRFSDKTQVLVVDEIKNQLVWVLNDQQKVAQVMNSIKEFNTVSIDKIIEETADLAVKLAQKIKVKGYDTVLMSGGSTIITYKLLQAAWKKVSDTPLKILTLNAQENIDLYNFVKKEKSKDVFSYVKDVLKSSRVMYVDTHWNSGMKRHWLEVLSKDFFNFDYAVFTARKDEASDIIGTFDNKFFLFFFESTKRISDVVNYNDELFKKRISDENIDYFANFLNQEDRKYLNSVVAEINKKEDGGVKNYSNSNEIFNFKEFYKFIKSKIDGVNLIEQLGKWDIIDKSFKEFFSSREDIVLLDLFGDAEKSVGFIVEPRNGVLYRFDDKEEVLVISNVRDKGVWVLKDEAKIYKLLNSILKHNAFYLDEAASKTAQAALNIAKQIKQNGTNTVVMSGASNVMLYEILKHAWNKISDSPLKIYSLSAQENYNLYLDKYYDDTLEASRNIFEDIVKRIGSRSFTYVDTHWNSGGKRLVIEDIAKRLVDTNQMKKININYVVLAAKQNRMQDIVGTKDRKEVNFISDLAQEISRSIKADYKLFYKRIGEDNLKEFEQLLSKKEKLYLDAILNAIDSKTGGGDKEKEIQEITKILGIRDIIGIEEWNSEKLEHYYNDLLELDITIGGKIFKLKDISYRFWDLYADDNAINYEDFENLDFQQQTKYFGSFLNLMSGLPKNIVLNSKSEELDFSLREKIFLLEEDLLHPYFNESIWNSHLGKVALKSFSLLMTGMFLSSYVLPVFSSHNVVHGSSSDLNTLEMIKYKDIDYNKTVNAYKQFIELQKIFYRNEYNRTFEEAKSYYLDKQAYISAMLRGKSPPFDDYMKIVKAQRELENFEEFKRINEIFTVNTTRKVSPYLGKYGKSGVKTLNNQDLLNSSKFFSVVDLLAVSFDSTFESTENLDLKSEVNAAIIQRGLMKLKFLDADEIILGQWDKSSNEGLHNVLIEMGFVRDDNVFKLSQEEFNAWRFLVLMKGHFGYTLNDVISQWKLLNNAKKTKSVEDVVSVSLDEGSYNFYPQSVDSRNLNQTGELLKFEFAAPNITKSIQLNFVSTVRRVNFEILFLGQVGEKISFGEIDKAPYADSNWQKVSLVPDADGSIIMDIYPSVLSIGSDSNDVIYIRNVEVEQDSIDDWMGILKSSVVTEKRIPVATSFELLKLVSSFSNQPIVEKQGSLPQFKDLLNNYINFRYNFPVLGAVARDIEVKIVSQIVKILPLGVQKIFLKSATKGISSNSAARNLGREVLAQTNLVVQANFNDNSLGGLPGVKYVKGAVSNSTIIDPVFYKQGVINILKNPDVSKKAGEVKASADLKELVKMAQKDSGLSNVPFIINGGFYEDAEGQYNFDPIYVDGEWLSPKTDDYDRPFISIMKNGGIRFIDSKRFNNYEPDVSSAMLAVRFLIRDARLDKKLEEELRGHDSFERTQRILMGLTQDDKIIFSIVDSKDIYLAVKDLVEGCNAKDVVELDTNRGQTVKIGDLELDQYGNGKQATAFYLAVKEDGGDNQKLIDLLNQAKPQIIERKVEHIDLVVEAMNAFVKNDFNVLYEMFSPQLKLKVDKDEYIRELQTLKQVYDALSDNYKEIMKVLVMFHDVGNLKNVRAWDHYKVGSQRIKEILNGVYDKKFIEDVSKLIYLHSSYYNLGVDLLPNDFKDLNSEEKDVLMLMSLFDGVRSIQRGNIFSTPEIKLLKKLRYDFVDEKDFFHFRLGKLLLPLCFVKQQEQVSYSDIDKELAKLGGLDEKFIYNWNNLIRIHVFNLFYNLKKKSVVNFFKLVMLVHQLVEQQKRNGKVFKDVIVDTDINFMYLDYIEELPTYINKVNALIEEGRDIPVELKVEDGSLRINFELSKLNSDGGEEEEIVAKKEEINFKTPHTSVEAERLYELALERSLSFERKMELLKEANQKDPMNFIIRNIIPKVLTDQKKYEEAQDWAKETIFLIANIPEEYREYRDFCYFRAKNILADIYLSINRLEEALLITEELKKIDPNNVSVYSKEFKVYFNLGKYPQALEAIDKQINLLKTNKALERKFRVLLKLRKYEEAVLLINDMIQDKPYNSDLYSYLYEVLVRLKRYDEAVLAAEKIIELRPKNYLGYDKKCLALIEVKRYKDLAVFVEECIRNFPDKFNFIGYKLKAMEKLNRYDEALEVVNKLIQNSPGNSLLYMHKFHILIKLQRYKEAVEVSDEFVKDGNLDKALAVINQQLRKFPNNRTLNVLKARLVLNLGIKILILEGKNAFINFVNENKTSVKYNQKLKYLYMDKITKYSEVNDTDFLFRAKGKESLLMHIFASHKNDNNKKAVGLKSYFPEKFTQTSIRGWVDEALYNSRFINVLPNGDKIPWLPNYKVAYLVDKDTNNDVRIVIIIDEKGQTKTVYLTFGPGVTYKMSGEDVSQSLVDLEWLFPMLWNKDSKLPIKIKIGDQKKGFLKILHSKIFEELSPISRNQLILLAVADAKFVKTTEKYQYYKYTIPDVFRTMKLKYSEIYLKVDKSSFELVDAMDSEGFKKEDGGSAEAHHGVAGEEVKRLFEQAREEVSYEDKVELLLQANKLDPNNYAVLGQLVFCYYHLKNLQEETNWLEKFLLVSAEEFLTSEEYWNSEILKTFGVLIGLYLKNSRGEDALRLIEKRIELNPNDLVSYWQRIQGLMELKRNEEALADIEKLMVLRPETEFIYFQKSQALFNLEKYQESLEAIEIQLKQTPNNAKSLKLKRKCEIALKIAEPPVMQKKIDKTTLQKITYMVENFIEEQKYGEALAVLEEAIRLFPNKPYFYEQSSNVLRMLGRKKEALVEIQEAIRLAPNNAIFHAHASQILRELNRNEEALIEVNEAISYAPQDAFLHEQASYILRELDRKEEAVIEIKKAINLIPKKANFYKFLSQLLRELGNIEEALNEIKEAILLAPMNPIFHGQASQMLRKLGKKEEALLEINESLRLSPNDFISHAQASQILKELGKYEEALIEIKKAIQLKPSDFRSRAQAYLLLQLLGKHEEALLEIKEAVRLEPNDSISHAQLSLVLRELGRLEEALVEINEAKRLNPNSALNYGQKAQILMELGRPEEAFKDIQEAIRLNPNNPISYVQSSKILMILEQKEAALVMVNKAISLNPNDLISHEQASHILKELNKKEEALKEIKEVIRLDPNNLINYSRACSLLREMNRLDEALLEIKEVVRLEPNSPVNYAITSQILRELGRLDEALIEIKKAKQLDSNNALSYGQTAQILMELDRNEEAFREIQKSIQLNPNNPISYMQASQILMNLGQKEGALVLINKAIVLNAQDSVSRVQACTVLMALDKKEEALKEIQEAIRLRPNDSKVHAQAYLVLKELNRNEEALIEIKKAISLDADNSISHSQASQVLKDLGRYEEALEEIDEAILLNSEFSFYHEKASQILKILGRYEDALEEIKTATRLTPGKSKLFRQLSQILMELDRNEGALSVIEKAISLDPQDKYNYIVKSRILFLTGIKINFLEGEEAFKNFLDQNKKFLEDDLLFQRWNDEILNVYSGKSYQNLILIPATEKHILLEHSFIYTQDKNNASLKSYFPKEYGKQEVKSWITEAISNAKNLSFLPEDQKIFWVFKNMLIAYFKDKVSGEYVRMTIIIDKNFKIVTMYPSLGPGVEYYEEGIFTDPKLVALNWSAPIFYNKETKQQIKLSIGDYQEGYKKIFYKDILSGLSPVEREQLVMLAIVNGKKEKQETKDYLYYLYEIPFASWREKMKDSNFYIKVDKKTSRVVDAMDSEGFKKEDGGQNNDLGGIDFRVLPMVTQAIDNLKVDMFKISLNKIQSIDVDKKLQEMQNMLSVGIVPSKERIQEFVAGSCLKDNAKQYLAKAVCCIADVMRLEEEKSFPSNRTIKDILVVLESNIPSNQMKNIFIGVN